MARPFAAVYASFFDVRLQGEELDSWSRRDAGLPDFACGRVAAVQALNGRPRALYDLASFTAAQAAFVGLAA